MEHRRARRLLRNATAVAATAASLFCASVVAGKGAPERLDQASGGGRPHAPLFDGQRNRTRAASSPDSSAFATITCTILDGQSGAPLPVRASVRDRLLEYRYPLPASSCFYHWPSVKCPGFFYADGAFTLVVPEGEVTIGLGHGFEYATVTDTVCVVADTVLTYALEPWIDLSQCGWFSGDCHMHMDHGGGVYSLTPADVWFMGAAEDLNVINCMDGPFLGQPDPVSTPECILFISEEQRSFVYGHSGLMGLSRLYQPALSFWWPLIMDIADEVHSQSGAAIVSVHPATSASMFDIESIPGTMKARELPIDLARGKIDGLEVLASGFLAHEGEIALWHRLLNCGFRIPPTAGSDAKLNCADGWPVGCFKCYVRMPPGEFDFWHWLKELFRAETFVTNGPLITAFSIDHLTAGDSEELVGDPPFVLEGHISVACTFPLKRADIVRNGERLKSFFFERDRCVMDTTFAISIDESSWIGARIVGDNDCWFTIEDSLFAHTGPIYIELNGTQILESDDAAYFVDWVDEFERLVDSKGRWTTPAESVRVFAEIDRARRHYEALSQGIDTSVASPTEPPSTSLRALPNPFTDETAVRFTLAAQGPAAVRVYTPSGRLVATVADRWFASGEHAVTWDGKDRGGREAGSGIYFCRLDAAGTTTTAKLVLLR